MLKRPFWIFYCFLFSLSASLSAQKNINSPYARFNLGELNLTGSYRALGMGGTGVATRDNNSIYFLNPASYTSIDTTSFVFDFGIDLGKTKLIDNSQNFNSLDMNFNHLLMGFPLSKKIGFAIGLLPFSNGYYSLSEVIKEGSPGYDPNAGQLTYEHNGSGSLSSLFAGTGFEISKNFSLGVNMNFIFGNLSRTSSLVFTDYSTSFDQAGNETYRIHGLNFDYGLQYTGKINKKYFINAGISYTSPSRLNSGAEAILTKYTTYSSTSIDTLLYTNVSSKDSTKLPPSYRAGIAFGKTDKFLIELDYTYTPWTQGRTPGTSSNLADVSSWKFGMEYIPDKFSNTSFFKRIEYRIGGHFANDYLKINGTQLKEYGISLGLGLRMRPTVNLSKTNIFFDYTRREGDLSKGLFNEDIYSVGISLNLYDWWFLKRKYD